MLFHPPFWLYVLWAVIWAVMGIMLSARCFKYGERTFAVFVVFLLPVPLATVFSVAITCWLMGWTSQ